MSRVRRNRPDSDDAARRERRGATKFEPSTPRSAVYRLPMLLAVVGLVAGAVWFRDDGSDEIESVAPSLDVAALVPVADTSSSVSALWFCAAGTGVAGGIADHVVVVSNVGDTVASGQLTVVPAGPDTQPDPFVEPIEVAPRTRLAIRLGDVIAAPYVAAQVETTGGIVVVEHQLTGPTGFDVARCSNRAASTWYLPWGQTTRGSELRLALFNPFPGDAVVKITLVTESTVRTPTDFESLLIPAGRLVVLDLTSVVPIYQRVSAVVEAKSGRVVAERIQTVTGADGTVALDVSTGATAPSEAWLFPDGKADATAIEKFVVHNPGETTVEVEIVLLGVSNVTGLPDTIRVPAGSSAEYVVNRSTQVQLPIEHSTLVQARDGGLIVVERVLLAGAFAQPDIAQGADQAAVPTTLPVPATQPGTDPTQTTTTPPAVQLPGLVDGIAASLGSPVVGTSWLLPSVAPSSGTGSITILNVGDDPVTVTVQTMTGPAMRLADEEIVQSGARLELDVPAELREVGFIVKATGPVVAARLLASQAPRDIGAELGLVDPVGAAVAEATTGLDPAGDGD